MPATIHFELLTPNEVLLTQEVDEVIAPGRDGYFGVLPGHTWFATTLKKGVLTVKMGNQTRTCEVDGGVIQVTPDKVIVCAEKADFCEVKPV